MALGGSVRPLLHLSGAGPLVDSTRVVAEPRPYECAVDSALGQQCAHAADTYQWGFSRFRTAEQFVRSRARMAPPNPLGSAAEAPQASGGSSAAPPYRYYPGKRDLAVTALAERLGIATDIVMLATQSVRWSIVSDALRVLTTSLHHSELTVEQRNALHAAVAFALQRPRGLAELLRACAGVVRSPEMTPALFLTIIAEDVGIRRRFGPLVDDVELFSMLFEHLGPRGSGRYQGNAELLYVLEMARRGQRVTRVNPHGPPHEYRCDFALPDATGDTLVEIKRCFGGGVEQRFAGQNAASSTLRGPTDRSHPAHMGTAGRATGGGALLPTTTLQHDAEGTICPVTYALPPTAQRSHPPPSRVPPAVCHHGAGHSVRCLITAEE